LYIQDLKEKVALAEEEAGMEDAGVEVGGEVEVEEAAA